jgi:hypothetical protein
MVCPHRSVRLDIVEKNSGPYFGKWVDNTVDPARMGPQPFVQPIFAIPFPVLKLGLTRNQWFGMFSDPLSYFLSLK